MFALAGSLFGSASTACGSSLSRTGTGHPVGPSARIGATYTTGTSGSVGAVTGTGFTPFRSGPLNPTSVVLPRWITRGNAVVVPGNEPIRTR